MSIRINTNIEALNAQRNLSGTASLFAKSVERLSSGLRINRAADDAAGLAISQKLSAQVTGLNQAERNSQDGISMVQTAEGALTEVHSMLQRVRELAVEASNSTLSTTDAASVATEITALRSEIDRIATSTKFNGQSLLTGVLSVSQTGGTLAANTALTTGHAAAVTSVDVSGGTASTTYTLTSTAPGKLTLSNGAGVTETVTLSAIGASGTATIDFSHLGVKINVAGDPAKTAAELATDLSAAGTPVTSALGGASGADLVLGDTLAQASGTPVAGLGIGYFGGAGMGGFDDSGGSTLFTATASPGVATGTFQMTSDSSGNLTGTIGGETFTGALAAPNPGASETVVLTGTRGDTITLNYKQGTASFPFNQDMATMVGDLGSPTFNFVAGTGTASVTGLTVNPASTAGTYTFTSSGAGSITLAGPGGSQTLAVADIAGNGTQTLNFNTLGVSFTLTADGAGISKDAIVSNLLRPSNDTIVVTSSGGAPATNTIVTGAGTQANFQVGANAGEVLGVSFADVQVGASGYGSWNSDVSAFESATAGGSGIFAAAQALITSTDDAIGYISTTRGKLGAVQNRLSHTIASVSVASENLTASLSRIRDLDIASEMVVFTKTQILQQAGTAILAQANSAPQNILSLLR